MPSVWPSLPYEDWSATCDTLHAHTQVLGKLAVGARAARAAAAARGAAADRARLGDAAAAGARRLGRARRRARPADARGGRRAQRRPSRSASAHARPVGRRRSRATCSPRSRALVGRCRDRPEAAGDAVDEAARRGRRARDIRRRRRSTAYFAAADARGARPGRAPRPLPGPLDPGQRLVGLVRPRRQPLLRPPGRPAVAGLHHAELDGLPGGRRRLVARRRALPARRVLRLRPPGAGRVRERDALARRPPAGTTTLGEFILDWDDVCASDDPFGTALAFARSLVLHACDVCAWDPALAASIEGDPPPVR